MVPNKERGEVLLELNGVQGIICAEMGRLARLSGAVGAETLADLYKRLAGAEPLAMYASIDCLVTEGDVLKLRGSLKYVTDFQVVADAVQESLTAFLKADDGKKRQGETKKA